MTKIPIKEIAVFVQTIILFCSCSNRIIPDKPFLSKTSFKTEVLPESEINIPIQVNLKPLYSLAEKNVATIFNSPGWPDDWVNLDCASRYKYQFRRSPLQFRSSGNYFNIGFTGYYKIIGSTRVCLGNTVVTPWTPPCRCGYDEGERKVNVSFTNSVSIFPDYKVKLNIKREEPVPIDKCNVCFFGADITNQVMNGLRDELDLSKKAIEDSFGVMDIKPQVQQIWNRLNTSYNIYGLGWLQINPQKIRLNNLNAQNDSLNINLGITAKPVIRFDKPTDYMVLVPEIDNKTTKPGFNIFLDAMLNYDSLSQVLNAQIKGRQFDFKKGKIRKKIIVNDCRIYGAGNEKLIIKMSFSGSNTGIVYFTGKPFYDEQRRMIEIRDIDFDVKTQNLLLKSADWLFNKRISNEIARASTFDVSAYADSAIRLINSQLNQEWYKGVTSYGNIDQLKIIGFYPESENLIIRSQASGQLFIKVDSVDFSF